MPPTASAIAKSETEGGALWHHMLSPRLHTPPHYIPQQKWKQKATPPSQVAPSSDDVSPAPSTDRAQHIWAEERPEGGGWGGFYSEGVQIQGSTEASTVNPLTLSLNSKTNNVLLDLD